jgi:CheY-like chemotaxis protein
LKPDGLVSARLVARPGDGCKGIPVIVRCPKCKTASRLRVADGEQRATNYFCPACRKIVLVDLRQGEIKPSPSVDSDEKTEHRKKVLVADDNERVRTFSVVLLRDAGYEALEAEDGLQAFNLIREKHPDLILLNLMLPLMTGYDIIEKIRNDTRIEEIPILLMSDVVSEREVFGTLDTFGIAGFMDKRHLKDSLVSRVQDILSKSDHPPA